LAHWFLAFVWASTAVAQATGGAEHNLDCFGYAREAALVILSFEDVNFCDSHLKSPCADVGEWIRRRIELVDLTGRSPVY
jgi:hypothetical protein